jgi:anti-anti-sigma regulatory factor
MGMQTVQVTRIGTQVVVRLTGEIGDDASASLDRAYAEVCELASSLVAVDLEDADLIEGAGLDFLGLLHSRWRVKLLNAPRGLRARLASAS